MRIIFSIFITLGLLAVAPGADAKGKDPQAEEAPPPAATPKNECGCYRDAQDQCHCEKQKKLKCVCENDCEPPACEAERAKRSEKEAAAQLKKIQERDKKAQAEAKAAQAKKAKEKAAEDAKKKKESGSRWQ
jgi:hypothetical protein